MNYSKIVYTKYFCTALLNGKELMNQYRACLYLFECISQGDDIPNVDAFENVLKFLTCRLLMPAAWKVLNLVFVTWSSKNESELGWQLPSPKVR